MAEGDKIPLLGMTLAELKEVAGEVGMPSFAARQMAGWLYGKKVSSIDGMTDISARNRALLSERYAVGCSKPVEEQRSADGTVKYLYRTAAGGYVETVYIPDGERATLCVSSQVGCRMNCRFCMTGKQGFSGQLTAADILNQLYSLPEREALRATELLTADYGYAWSPKRITVSTVGLRKGLKRFLDESECHLAVSLHNPFPEQRAQLMPAERSYSVRDIVSLLRTYDFTHQRRLSFEYTMFAGVNDTMAHARELLRLLDGLECRMNLIRFHPVPGVDLKGTSDEDMVRFRDYLTRHGLFSTIRASRGQDIFAACGLLSTAKQQGVKLKNIEL